MAEFSADDYFARRMQGAGPTPAGFDGTPRISDSKYAELEKASAEKIGALERNYQLRERDRQESWVGQLGLTPHSLAGRAVNLGASAVEGVGQILGAGGSAIYTGQAMAYDSQIPDVVKQARARQLKNEATPQDLELLNLPYGETDPNPQLSHYQRIAREDAAKRGIKQKTNLEQLQDMELAVDRAGRAKEAMNFSGVVHGEKRREFIDSLKQGFREDASKVSEGWDQGGLAGSGKVLEGITGLIANIGVSAVNNPQASAEYIVQNLPQIAMATKTLGMAVTNVPYAVDAFREGITEYAKKNNGAMPPAEEMQRMAGMAASLLVAETVGDKLVLGGRHLLGKGAKELPQAALEVTSDATRKGFKQALTGAAKALADGPAGRILGRTVGGATGEFGTEAYQTFAENEIKGEKTTLEDAYVGGAIGAIAGGGTSAGIQTLGEAANVAANVTAKSVDKSVEVLTQREAQKAAIQSADVSAMVDPAKPTYAPDQAIAALHGNAKQADTTEEVQQARFEEASKIVTGVEERKSELEQLIQMQTPEGIQTLLEEAQTDLGSSDPQVAEVAQQRVEILTEELTALQTGGVNQKYLDQLTGQLEKVDRQLQASNTALSAFTQDRVRKVDLNTEVAAVSNPVTPEAGTVAARKVVTLAMEAPERVSVKLAMQLAEDAKNAFNAAERAYLKAFAESKQAVETIRSMDQVNQRVLRGEGKDIGIIQYQDAVRAALSRNDKTAAEKSLAGLEKFSKDHSQKAQLASSVPAGTQIIRNAKNEWVTADREYTPSEMKKNGWLTVNSKKLTAAISAEADALNKSAMELRSAIDVKFDSQSFNGATQNVQNQSPKQEAGKQEKAKGNGVQKTEAVGSDAKSPGRASSEQAQSSSETAAVGGVELKSTEEAPSSSVPSVDSTQTEQTKGTEGTEQTEGQNQSNREDTTAQDSTKEVPDGTSDGKLSILDQTSEKGTPFAERKNLVADFFTQSAGKDTDGSQRPLVALRDALSKGKEALLKFTPFTELSEEQDGLLTFFESKAKTWAEKIQKNLVRKGNPQFWRDDMLQFLMTDTDQGPVLEGNVTTALTYAAFSWVQEAAGRPAFNDPEAINMLLGRDRDHEVSTDEQAILGRVGGWQNAVINSMGQRAVQALGLQAKPDAPADLMPKLEWALGVRAMRVLMDEGILERTSLSKEDAAKVFGNKVGNQTLQFLRLARDGNLKLPLAAQQIVDAGKQTQSFLDRLFKTDAGMVFPSLTPMPFTQKRTDTGQEIPKELAKSVAYQQSQPNYVRLDMMNLVGLFDERMFLEMAGAEFLDEKVTHQTNLLSQQAKNDGLARELQNWKDYMAFLMSNADEDGNPPPIFLEYTVWKQQRVGIKTNAINPQTSKIHRHMLYRKTWETVINLDNEAEMMNFQLRVAEGMGIKTDKQSSAKALLAYEKMVANPKIQSAVEALRKGIYEGQMTPNDQSVVANAVKIGGEKMHSFDALVALAHHAQAKASEQKSFTTHLMGEVDGVTNGPMLTHLLLGAANTVKDLFRILNRGGFFSKDDKHKNVNLWRDESIDNLDLYENTTKNMLGHLERLQNEKDRRNRVDSGLVPPIFYFTGALVDPKTKKITSKGRKIIKTPLTGTVFGSALKTAVNNMANDFLDTVYAKIEAVARDEEGTSREELISNLNKLGMQLPLNTPVQELLKPFSKDQIKGLKDSFTLSIGKAVEATLKEDFGVFLERRSLLNQSAAMAFDIYKAMYDNTRSTFLEELAQKGEIAVDGKGKPVHDLTKAQEAELAKRLEKLAPMIHTLMSKQDGNINAGRRMAKNERKLSQRPTHKSEVLFATPFSDNGAKSASGNGMEMTEEGPGAGTVVLSVHSTDSAISHSAALLGEVLNVHDAHGAGLATFEKTARNLNQSTWTAMLNYSPANEIYSALSGTIQGLAEILKQDGITDEAKAALADVARKYLPRDLQDTDTNPLTTLHTMLMDAKAAAYASDKMKLEAMAQMTAIDQYALEGAYYEVTDADRAQAQKMLEQLVPDLTKEDEAATATIIEALKDRKAETKDLEIEEDQDVIDAPSSQKSSPWGDLGTPVVEADPILVRFFKSNPQTTASRVIQGLINQYKSRNDLPNQAFNLKMLAVISRLVDPELKVLYVTPGTAADQVMDRPAGASRGWFSFDNGDPKAEAIYVLSPEHRDSGLTPELLLHELVHGALARTIQQELDRKAADPKYTSDALELINELEELREQAKKLDKAGNFKEATTNIHEFVTWGMTNQEFQANILNKIQGFKSKNWGNKLVSGMKAFIGNLVRMMFKDTDKRRLEIAENGFGVLIGNVSGLFAQAAQTRQDQKKGSSGVTTLAQASPMNTINELTTNEVLEALDDGQLDEEFQTYLGNVMSMIVNRLQGPFGALKRAAKAAQAITPLDVWTKALDTGAAPFASQVVASPLGVHDQEAFTIEMVEATMQAALADNDATTKEAYRELAKLFNEVRKLITPADFHVGDWALASPQERELAQEQYDFVFKVEASTSSGDRSDYLARFAGLGLGHRKVAELISLADSRWVAPTKQAKTFAERLQRVLEKVLGFFSQRATGTYEGQPMNEKLAKLVDRLVDIEAKRLHQIGRTKTNFLAPMEQGARNVTESIRGKIVDIASSQWVRQNARGTIRGIGAIARTVANDRVDQLLDTISKFRDTQSKERQNILESLVTEAKGHLERFQAVLRYSKHNEGIRKDVITQTSKLALKVFDQEGANLTTADRSAISAVFLRTGVHNLLDKLSMSELLEVLTNKKQLDQRISTLEGQLSRYPKRIRAYYIMQANALGYFKATGKAKSEFLMLNAYNIAQLFETGMQDQITTAQKDAAEDILKQLVTLNALRYSKYNEMLRARDVLKTESARANDENGIEFTLKAHRAFEQESLARLFGNNKTQMIHGYTPEIFNPHTEVKAANEEEGEGLKDMGYTKGTQVPLDPLDPDQEIKHLYVRTGGGLQPYLTGAVSLTSKKAKGTLKHNGYLNIRNQEGVNNAAMNATIGNAKRRALYRELGLGKRDLSQEKGTYLVPVLNEQGSVVNYRYMMQEDTKDTLLQRDGRFDQVLGVLAGSIFDKETSREQNKTALKAMLEQYDAEYNLRKDSYVLVGPASTNPDFRELWDLLPDDTKMDAQAMWGKDGIWVRRDSLNILFGYRKMSLTEVFNKDPEDRKAVEQFLVDVVEWSLGFYARTRLGMTQDESEKYAKRAAWRVAQSERAWQELVRETKDILVVKSGVTLMGNIWSNFSLLALNGVSLKDMMKHHLIALKASTAYQQDMSELSQLQMRLQAGYTQDEQEIRVRIAELKDAIARNPVKELIDAGLMPTIVEDVSADEDIYSYKSALTNWVDNKTANVPEGLRTAGRVLYMAHDTKLYQGLSRITQLSDFVARYTLYQHLTTKAEPLSKAAAIQEASDAFINYDIPMHRGMQYSDDMGLTMFTKYFLRIQKVLMKTAKENPLRVFTMILLDNLMDLGPIVLDSAMMTRIGNNPFNIGALKFPSVLDDLATVSSAMKVIK